MAFSIFGLAFLAVAVFVASCIGVRLIEAYLHRRAILDVPGDRSSHDEPTPRGGGLVVIAVVLLAWTGLYSQGFAVGVWALIIGGAICAAISWLDDLSHLSPLIRLPVHFGAVAVGLFWLSGQGLVFQGLLPPWIDLALAGLGWVAFLNFFNFMDGIDGISAVESVTISIGLALMAWLVGGPDWQETAAFPTVIAGAMAGFAVWNWSPARIFLGDVGSVTLGYLLGALLLAAAAQGYWVQAIILPLYYLADAGLTLMRRALRREKIWHAHREHFFQKAVQRRLGHARVSAAVLLANLVLVGLALWTLVQPQFALWALLAAAAAVAALMAWMTGRLARSL
ncbi:MAG: glycosyltransferase family 4 protein [Alphaproteobacteria bacterium]|nr:glycosyltransferase family 4 protein [Alphaproteobacteria bacterium]